MTRRFRTRRAVITALVAAALLPFVGVLAAPVAPVQAAAAAEKALPLLGSGKAARRQAEQITAPQLRDYLTFIASDEMEGRDTPSRGLDTAALFLATLLSRWGLKPMGDNGTFFQSIALRRTRIDPARSSAALAGQTLRYGDDFLIQGRTGGTVSAARLVYVSHGWVVPARNINAYQGVDVRGKVLIVSGARRPEGVSNAVLREGKRGVDWIDPAAYAVKNGALGIIRLPTSAAAERWEQARTAAQRDTGGSVVVERFQTEEEEAGVPTITLSPALVETLFRGEARLSAETALTLSASGAASPAFDLGDSARTLTFTVHQSVERMTTRNVVAAVVGSDARLRAQYVALGAHYDHVGVGRPNAQGDTIFNGAHDDGSGTVALLAMAEAFARSSPRPRRSLLFVWHTGEEQGLWGSEYFTRFPTVPLNRIVTQLNIDMIGRSKAAGDKATANAELAGPNEVYVIGSRRMSTELGDLSERVNRDYLKLTLNYRYDDPKDPNGFFFRSDHYNYARRGVPILFYFDGVHEDYHRQSDEVAKIDFAKMAKITRTIFVTAVEIANLLRPPRVDKKLTGE